MRNFGWFHGWFLYGCCLLLLGGACKQSLPEDESSTASTTISSEYEVYVTPGGQLLTRIPADEPVERTGRVSERLFSLYTPTDTFFAPYLEVLLATGEVGWVYARPDTWSPLVGEEPARWQAENRIQALLGEARLRDYRAYRQRWTRARAGEAVPLLVQAFRTARSLRDELQEVLATYPEQPLSAAAWESLLPGFHCQLDDEQRPRWWVDYRQWLALSRQLGDAEASALFGIYCQVYPQDNIEYFYPVWRIAESRNVQHSLLGRGIHTRLLRELEPLQDFTSLAGVEAGELYATILQDVLSPEASYWESTEQILAELDTLLQASTLLRDSTRRNSLHDRRTAFAAGRVPVNLRAGQLPERSVESGSDY